MDTFAEKLKYLRKEKNLSLLRLSEQLYVSDAAICKWETGATEPTASNIIKIADFFEVSSDYLLGLENDCGAKKYDAPNIVVEDLSKDEKELLDIFRSLSHGHGLQVLEYARYFADRENNIKTKK